MKLILPYRQFTTDSFFFNLSGYFCKNKGASMRWVSTMKRNFQIFIKKKNEQVNAKHTRPLCNNNLI